MVFILTPILLRVLVVKVQNGIRRSRNMGTRGVRCKIK